MPDGHSYRHFFSLVTASEGKGVSLLQQVLFTQDVWHASPGFNIRSPGLKIVRPPGPKDNGPFWQCIASAYAMITKRTGMLRQAFVSEHGSRMPGNARHLGEKSIRR
jgi:hypothetical protein